MKKKRNLSLALVLVAVTAETHATSLVTVHTFSGLADGGNPRAGLTLHGHALYGTAYGGGPDCWSQTNCNGTVFRYDPKAQRLTTLYAFEAAADGFAPAAGVTFQGGLIYGTTSNQGFLSGTVFELDPRTRALNTLYTFTGGDDGALPLAGLAYCKGSLYGTNFAGSAGLGSGTAFQYDLAKHELRTLHGFSLGQTSSGLSPLAGVTFRGQAFYGTTSEGGIGPSAVGCGTLYRIDPVANAFDVVHRFNGPDGCTPTASLLNVRGTLYGTTSEGGANDLGTVFRFDPVKRHLTTLHSFDLGDGAYPQAGVMMHNGCLYGTTAGISTDGVIHGNGTVFRLCLGKNRLRTVHTFTGGDDGSAPLAGLVLYQNALYGTTSVGGAQGQGTVFKIQLPQPKASVAHD